MMNFKIVSWGKLFPFLIVFGCGSAESVSNGNALGNADSSEGMNEEETVSSNEPAYDWRDLRDFLAITQGLYAMESKIAAQTQQVINNAWLVPII